MWEKGLYAELAAYRCQVFLDFSVVRDDDKSRWSGLAGELGGRGVPSIDAALRARELRPVREAFLAALAEGTEEAVGLFVSAALPFAAGRLDAEAARSTFRGLAGRKAPKGAGDRQRALLRAWLVLRPLAGPEPAQSPMPGWLDEWMLTDLLAGHLERAGWDRQASQAAPALIAMLMTLPEVPKPRSASRQGSASPRLDWAALLSLPSAERLLGVHEFQGTRWFRKEALESLGAAAAILLETRGMRVLSFRRVMEAAEASGWRWDELLRSLREKKARKR
jgi:hypothetical protein